MYVRLPLVPESMDPWIANALSGLLYFCVSRVQTLLSSVLVVSNGHAAIVSCIPALCGNTERGMATRCNHFTSP